MTIEATATQLSNVTAQLDFTTTDADPVAGFDIGININAAGVIGLGVLSGTQRLWLDAAGLWVPGDSVVYEVIDKNTLTVGLTDALLMADLDAPYTFGPVNPLVDTIRYTSLDDVKLRMGIDHAEDDAQLTEAIIAAEVAIDQVNNRSLPDTGINPEIPGVPAAISTWALDASIAIWKAADAPFGQGGGDAWLGSLDVQNITERILRRHPLALGYKVAWGVA